MYIVHMAMEVAERAWNGASFVGSARAKRDTRHKPPQYTPDPTNCDE